jgi:hypothetical protein
MLTYTCTHTHTHTHTHTGEDGGVRRAAAPVAQGGGHQGARGDEAASGTVQGISQPGKKKLPRKMIFMSVVSKCTSTLRFFFGDRRRGRETRLVRRELPGRATLFWRCVRACGKRFHFFGKLFFGKRLFLRKGSSKGCIFFGKLFFGKRLFFGKGSSKG